MGPDHPWRGKGFAARKKCVAEFKAWLNSHQDTRLRQGDVRADGLVFHAYQVGYRDGEHWTTPENFKKQLERVRKTQRRLRKDPAFALRFNEYVRSYANADGRRLKTSERGKRHRQEKPWMVAASTRRRYALKRARTHPDNDRRVERAMFKLAADLSRATRTPHHVDHIIPLVAGGWHHHDNLQVLPDTVNLSKGTNPFWVSSWYRDFRSVPQALWPDDLADIYLAMLTAG